MLSKISNTIVSYDYLNILLHYLPFPIGTVVLFCQSNGVLFSSITGLKNSLGHSVQSHLIVFQSSDAMP